MPPAARPPGAPRKQAPQQQHQHAGAGDQGRSDAGPSSRPYGASSSSTTTRAPRIDLHTAGPIRMPSTSTTRSASSASTGSQPSMSGDGRMADAARNGASLFGAHTQAAQGASSSRQAATRDAGHSEQSWLSQRPLPPVPTGEADFDPSMSSMLETPTGRTAAHDTWQREQMRAPNGADHAAFATPVTNGARTQGGGEPSLLTQITRRLAAARRPNLNRVGNEGARQAAAAARTSLASSSGWGSPAGAADSLDFEASSPTVRQTAPVNLGTATPATDVRPTTEQAPTFALRAPPPAFARFGLPTTHVAPTNHDGSQSVVRDDFDANNSGLLALTPAVRGRLPNLTMTSLRPRSSKASSESSFLRGPGETSKLARSSEPSDRSLGIPPSIIEYDLEGVDVASADEMEARRAALLGRSDLFEEPTSEEREALIETMRGWREDAMKHHLYDTAIFWGNKVLSMETSQIAWNDAYNLATAFFLTHRYAQAEHLLCSPLKLASSQQAPEDHIDGPSDDGDALGRALAASHKDSKLPASMLAKSEAVEQVPDSDMDDSFEARPSSKPRVSGKRKTREFTVSGTGTASEAGSVGANGETEEAANNNGAGHPDGTGDRPRNAVRARRSELDEVHDRARPSPDGISLVDVSVPCKYLAAQCMVRQGKHQEALDELDLWGEGNDDDAFRDSCKQSSRDGLIKLSSSIWHLKGMIHLHLRHVEAARDNFIKSLSLDVKNFESFDQLVRGNLLSAKEQWELMDSLQFVAQAGSDPTLGDALQLVRFTYTSLLSKSCKQHIKQAASARRELAGLYGLHDNPDTLLSLAEELYGRLKYRDAYQVTRRIMELSKDHEAALPVHVSSMQMVEELRPSLFLLAHHLTETDPDLPAAWYAVGCWYYSTRRWLEARKYFSKSVQIDPRFAPGWVAFAHTFALEGESDQAIVSYSTAERNFSSHYLVKLFLGMEHLSQGNLTLAQMYMGGSAEVWEEDPLSRNERGVVAYYNGDFDAAIDLFRGALQAAKSAQQPASAWASTHLNLGCAYRRKGEFKLARDSFLRTIELDVDCVAAYIGAGMCHHAQGDVEGALSWYHRALAVSPTDKSAHELADLALHESARLAPDIMAPPLDKGRPYIPRAVRAPKQESNADTGLSQNVNDEKGMDAERQGRLESIVEDSGEAEKKGNGHARGSTSLSLADGSASIDMDVTEA